MAPPSRVQLFEGRGRASPVSRIRPSSVEFPGLPAGAGVAGDDEHGGGHAVALDERLRHQQIVGVAVVEGQDDSAAERPAIGEPPHQLCKRQDADRTGEPVRAAERSFRR